MKKISLVIVVILMAGLAHAQELKVSEVPASVKESFTKRFPNAKEVKWSKESATEFEAEFESGEMEQSANFDQTGKWLVTETEIKKLDLPEAVLITITKEFPGYKVEEAEKGETFDAGIFYEAELEKGKLKYEVQFSGDGKILKKEELKEKGKSKD